MPTGGKDSGAARLTPAQQRALRQLLAKAKASQREAKQTQAKAQHVNDRKPKPTETRAETAARQNAERSRRDLAARRHGRPADYGQSLPDSVHPPRPTRAQVEKSRRRSDPLAGAIKTAGALTGPLARDVAGQPKSLYENVKYLSGQRKTQPKPPTESAVFYPALARALAKSVAEDVKDPKHHKLNLAL